MILLLKMQGGVILDEMWFIRAFCAGTKYKEGFRIGLSRSKEQGARSTMWVC